MATITEDYVSFEIAKLLKEKGFYAEIDTYYSPEGELKIWYPNGLKSYLDNKGTETWWWKCIAPSQSMAMKWLREVHNLCIEPYRTASGYLYTISKIWTGSEIYSDEFNGDDEDSGQWTTYEKACEAAIKYCLENLI